MERKEHIELLSKLGNRYGTNKKSGVYNQADPTHYEQWTLAIAMEIGFGQPIATPEDDTSTPWIGYQPNSPIPEIIIIQWYDSTWGVTLQINSETLNLRCYWNHENHQWAWMKGESSGIIISGDYTGLDTILHRLIMEGDWGNNKIQTESEIVNGR